MSESLRASRPGDEPADVETARSQDRDEHPGALGLARVHARTPVLLGLQRSVGNAAVLQLLGGRRVPTAPPPPREEASAEAAAEGEPVPDGVPALDEGERPSREMRAEKRAEREGVSEIDEHVETGGGAFPIAEVAAAAGAEGFADGGRTGSVPFTDLDAHELDADRDGRPHAFVAGGRTGTKAWAGGGGAGPKGNQQSGSIQEQVEPEYDSSWGGVFTNADAWVKEGTGSVTAKRDYVSSSSGDQGNGWYVTDKAAAALEKHEQRHVTQTRSVYVDKIQPMLDRIVNSYNYGKGKLYKSSDAKTYVKRYIDWPRSIKAFEEDDTGWNAPNGQVDTEDWGSVNYPNQIGPGKVSGRDFTNRLKMPTEEAPPE